jgi:hypothetical protein
MELHALLPQHMLRGEQVLPLPVPPLGNHVRVLAKQQHIFDRARFSRGGDALL